MWNPFRAIIQCFRETNAAWRLKEQATQAASPTERVALPRQALQLTPTSNYIAFDLMVALARHGQFTEAAGLWRELLSKHHHRFLTEEEVKHLRPLLPSMAKEILADLTHPKSWYFGHPSWTMREDGQSGPGQHWKVETASQWAPDLEDRLRYAAVILAWNASGPGRAVFACDYTDSDGDSFAIGEVIWEWDAAKQVRCVRVQKV